MVNFFNTVGGKALNNTITSAVHMYNPNTDSWEVTSQMPTARYLPLAAVVNDSQLLLVGGVTDGDAITDSVEIAYSVGIGNQSEFVLNQILKFMDLLPAATFEHAQYTIVVTSS